MTDVVQGERVAPVPGSVLVLRDDEWLATRTERSSDGEWFADVQGVSELVRDTSATFSTVLDEIEVLDAKQAQVVGDDTPGHRRSRLWLEATLRKTAVPVTDPTQKAATHGLADSLPYQLEAVRKALDPQNPRPRILLAELITGADAASVPAAYALKDVPEAEREDAVRRERSLLYVAATRARDELVVVWAGQPSELLPTTGEA